MELVRRVVARHHPLESCEARYPEVAWNSIVGNSNDLRPRTHRGQPGRDCLFVEPWQTGSLRQAQANPP
jgi:hypothetical protein